MVRRASESLPTFVLKTSKKIDSITFSYPFSPGSSITASMKPTRVPHSFPRVPPPLCLQSYHECINSRTYFTVFHFMSHTYLLHHTVPFVSKTSTLTTVLEHIRYSLMGDGWMDGGMDGWTDGRKASLVHSSQLLRSNNLTPSTFCWSIYLYVTEYLHILGYLIGQYFSPFKRAQASLRVERKLRISEKCIKAQFSH